jgi:hypothetical protein
MTAAENLGALRGQLVAEKAEPQFPSFTPQTACPAHR